MVALLLLRRTLRRALGRGRSRVDQAFLSSNTHGACQRRLNRYRHAVLSRCPAHYQLDRHGRSRRCIRRDQHTSDSTTAAVMVTVSGVKACRNWLMPARVPSQRSRCGACLHSSKRIADAEGILC